jgi:molybdenum cofactor cytidylyltransferase
MRFEEVPVSEARGRILAHNVGDAEGRRVLRKGHVVDEDMVRLLGELGQAMVWAATLEEGDVHEDEAARRVAEAVTGEGLEVPSPHQARVNVKAAANGVFRADTRRVLELNRLPGLTVATVSTGTFVPRGRRAATIKVIPYAMSGADVERAEAVGRDGPILALDPVLPLQVGMVLVGEHPERSRRLAAMEEAVRQRVEGFGCGIAGVSAAAPRVAEVAAAVGARARAGAGVVVVAGETAIMDRDDLVPRAIRDAGGRVEHFGLPVDPGHLLLLAYLDGIPILGAPGCIMGSLPDGVDLVLPRLLVGERLESGDLIALGHGGLLADPVRR